MQKFFFVTILIVISCGNTLEEETSREITVPEDNPIEETNTKKNLKMLSLGDSYTIGESVCTKCKFPEQLKDSLLEEFGSETTIDLKVIAVTKENAPSGTQGRVITSETKPAYVRRLDILKPVSASAMIYKEMTGESATDEIVRVLKASMPENADEKTMLEILVNYSIVI